MNNKIDIHKAADPIIHNNYAQLHDYRSHTCDLEVYENFNY